MKTVNLKLVTFRDFHIPLGAEILIGENIFRTNAWFQDMKSNLFAIFRLSLQNHLQAISTWNSWNKLRKKTLQKLLSNMTFYDVMTSNHKLIQQLVREGEFERNFPDMIILEEKEWKADETPRKMLSQNSWFFLSLKPSVKTLDIIEPLSVSVILWCEKRSILFLMVCGGGGVNITGNIFCSVNEILF